MANFNKTILMGRLVADPDLKTIGEDNKVVNFTLAVNRIPYLKDGEKVEKTDFIDCQMFGNRAEHFANMHSKGSVAFVEGQVRQVKWTTEEGNRSKLVVQVDNFEMVGGNGPKAAEQEGKQQEKPSTKTNQQ